MSATAIETSLMLHVEQIIGGETRCQYCGGKAIVTIGNGADPDPEPMCAQHASDWLGFIKRAIEGVLTERG